MSETKQTIGQQLKQMRLSRHLSLEKVAEITRVRAYYLQALEEDNYSAMSSAAQGRGFLRLYADFLGLNLEAATTELRQGSETADTPPAPASPPAASSADEKPVRRSFWARLLRRPVSAPPTAETDSAPEPAPLVDEIFAPVPEPEPEPVPAAPVKKTAARKAKSPTKADKPQNRRQTGDKKKASLKSKSAPR